MQPKGSSEDRPPTVGVDHVGYTFASLSDLFETYARLKQDGIPSLLVRASRNHRFGLLC